MYKRNYLVGNVFGMLTVLSEAGRSKDRHILYECVCGCGNHKIVSSHNLMNGCTRSCGCRQRMKHGGRTVENTERLYSVWLGMRHRCTQQNDRNFKYYGERGISVCDEWQDYSVFREWAYANGYDENAPYMQCTIDRIDNNGNYEPGNCRWVTMMEQSKNKRIRHALEFELGT